jgi:hypothetical protein
MEKKIVSVVLHVTIHNDDHAVRAARLVVHKSEKDADSYAKRMRSRFIAESRKRKQRIIYDVREKDDWSDVSLACDAGHGTECDLFIFRTHTSADRVIVTHSLGLIVGPRLYAVTPVSGKEAKKTMNALLGVLTDKTCVDGESVCVCKRPDMSELSVILSSNDGKKTEIDMDTWAKLVKVPDHA